MDREEIFELLKKYNRNKCSPEEQGLLETWYLNDNQLHQHELSELKITADLDDVYSNLSSQGKESRLRWYIGIAACIALVMSLGIYAYMQPGGAIGNLSAGAGEQVIAPGKNTAILRLADGKVIQLSDAKAGVIVKSDALTYSDGSEVKNENSLTKGLQTIATPRGGNYVIELPDKSKVWLNAASSLTYSNALGKEGDRRFVELEGEAYFEVASDKKRPFVVFSSGAGGVQEVTVLGTHFNINSYADEFATKTTLLEGSVHVAKGQVSRTLMPGQQALVSQGISVIDVNPEQFVDWKNGNFYFDDENIKSIMRKLARWYDIEVTYKGTVPDVGFGGEISKRKNLSEVLSLLETKGVHFKVEGRRVTVMP